jgi:hypothetical protein
MAREKKWFSQTGLGERERFYLDYQMLATKTRKEKFIFIKNIF